MLDDNMFIPRPRFLLLGTNSFVDLKMGYLYENMKKLSYELDPSWKVILAHTKGQQEQVSKLLIRLEQLGIDLYEVKLFDASMSADKVKDLLYLSDISYIPEVLRELNLPVNFYRRPPKSAKQAIEAACYFSTAVEAFTHENYYRALDRIGI